MTTKVILVNTGPDPITVLTVPSNKVDRDPVPNQFNTLHIGPRTSGEVYVHQGQSLVVKEGLLNPVPFGPENPAPGCVRYGKGLTKEQQSGLLCSCYYCNDFGDFS